MKCGLETAAITCCVRREVKDGEGSILSEFAIPRPRARPPCASKSGRVAVAVCAELMHCPLLEGRVCSVSKNSFVESSRRNKLEKRMDKAEMPGVQKEGVLKQEICSEQKMV